MSRTSILILCTHFHPEFIGAGKYNSFLAQQLNKAGCMVEVIALYPFYPSWKATKSNADLASVKILRGGSLAKFSENMIIRRAQLELRFFVHFLRNISRIRESDIIITIFPPILYFIFPWYAFLRKGKIIGIVHDIQGVMAYLSKGILKKAIIKIVRILEKRAYQKCEKIIFLSKSMAKIGKEEYNLNPAKVTVCHPFVTLKNSIGDDQLNAAFPEGKLHVVYSGALGEKQNPFELLKVFQKVVKKRTDIYCHFFSDSPLVDAIKKQLNSSIDNILFHGLVPEKNLFELYQKSHLQVIPQKSGVSDGAIPSKLPNILYCGVPIFCICDPGSDVSEIANKSGIGHCSYHWNTEKLCDELIDVLDKSIIKSNKDRAEIVSEYIKENFDIEKLVKEIIE